jgi:neutral trehalase
LDIFGSTYEQYHITFPGDSIQDVRVTPMYKNQRYSSIRDYIMVVCQKDAHESCDTWQDISDARKAELKQYLWEYKFRGQVYTSSLP